MGKKSDIPSNNNKYPLAASPIDIGPVKLKNRIVFPTWQVNYANTDGTVSEKLLEFYTAMADGGCGLIFTGCAVVSPDTVAFNRVMRIDDDRYLPGLRKLFQEIESRGSVPGIQLIHYGRQALTSVTGCELIAPSPIPCPVMSKFDPHYKLREMTVDDIHRVYNDFIAAAARAAEAGARVIEVHAAHGYLLNEFLSPYSNHRTDDYGGNAINRARLILQIIRGIKDKLGNRVAISLRVSGNEFVEGGLRPIDFKDLIRQFEQNGIDMLNVSAGVYQSMERIVPPAKLGVAPHIDITAELKQYSRVPVCAVGSIDSLELAEEVLYAGKAELVAMGRAQVADPAIVNKSLLGKESEIRKCIKCSKCTFWTTGDPQMYCSVNPAYQRPQKVLNE
ncbi:tRNA-dihydrouridine synthase [Desulfallas thermosapovorans]|uniref:2,4-dienoyl-CoA reductase-like NADH-dependent reductase (Old Yellow Enzyme family) n=1 Tax=Desulfallas thermosapovorans DSM 6562 TaxID=1121431 RepID=A0A5S4ZY52_9FIRM|nr:NADH:flavin oxidoreductase [Desulfallas thermosapovorans]TYO97194.1 2,4-dienoyl-CoA reductase-like NADH-dependent reductase (Old Yellow Enzyme family) [Desulfallas thermosapovorans DSM 6562]